MGTQHPGGPYAGGPRGGMPHGAPSHGAPQHGAPSHGAPPHNAPPRGAAPPPHGGPSPNGGSVTNGAVPSAGPNGGPNAGGPNGGAQRRAGTWPVSAAERAASATGGGPLVPAAGTERAGRHHGQAPRARANGQGALRGQLEPTGHGTIGWRPRSRRPGVPLEAPALEVPARVASVPALMVRAALVRVALQPVRGDRARAPRTGVHRRTARLARPGSPGLRHQAGQAGLRRRASTRRPGLASKRRTDVTGPARRRIHRVQ